MKIAEVLYSTTIGGSERLGISLANGFRSRGHQCEVVTLFQGDRSLDVELNAADIPVHNIEFVGGSIRSKVESQLKLYRLFRRERYDVIHCHHMDMFFHCIPPSRLVGNNRLIVTEHAHQHFEWDEKLRRRSRRLSKHADRITVIHSELLDYFHDTLDVPLSKIDLIRNGVDTEKFSPGTPPLEISESIPSSHWDCTAMFVGRLHIDKDVPNLLKAHRALLDAGLNCGLVIVGDGAESQAIRTLIKDLALEPFTYLAGSKDNIYQWLRACDFFVLPSRREGAPLAILEAMSCGKAIVATDVGGIAEIVDDDCGITVPKEDHQALAVALQAMAADPAGRKQKGEKSRQRILDLFSINKMIDEYIDCFGR
ncbi:MAG: glycosyltransferase [Pseudomonadota bacterium]